MGVIGPIEAMVLRRKKLKQKLHSLFPADEAEAENLGSERLLSSKRPRRRGGSEAPGGGGVEERSGVEEGGEEEAEGGRGRRRCH
jgi:hypothetical protein